jgi:hypothetical protein
MSARAMEWAAAQTASNAKTQLVLWLLANAAAEDGFVDCGVAALDDIPAARVFTRAAIARAVDDLERRGFLFVLPANVLAQPIRLRMEGPRR